MMIGWVIWVMKFNWNVKKAPPPKSSNEKLIFILHLTSDDWPSDPSNKSRLKCYKRPPKSSKNEMLVFGLHSNSDDQPSNPSNESQPKCDKKPPKSSKNEMLGFGLHSTSDDWLCNPSNKSQLKCRKRLPKSSKNEILIFILCSTSDDWPSNQMPPPTPAEKVDFFKSTLLTWPKYAPPKNLSRIWTILHETFRRGLIFWARWNESKEWYAMVKTYENVNISVEYQRFCTKPSEEGSFFWTSWNQSKEWYAMMETYKNINISVEYQRFCTKPSEKGSFFQIGRNESKEWYPMIKTYKNINISVEYQLFCMKPSEEGHSLSRLKWVQGVVCYDWNLQKHKYLSGISMVLHETFRTGLIFPSRSKWVQGVVCYNQNLWKHKYLNGDEFPITFKVNYISEDLLPVMLTSCFFGWREVADGVRVHRPAQLIIRSWK